MRQHAFARRNLLPIGLILITLALLAFSAFSGGIPRANAANLSLDDTALEIGKELQCPICQNLAVAYSPSPLAAQMREIIRAKLQAGETREQIIQYFVDRYGEGILWNPPQTGWNLIAWRVPILALVLGAVGLFVLLRNWTRPRDELKSSPLDAPAVDEYDARLEAELEQRNREVWE